MEEARGPTTRPCDTNSVEIRRNISVGKVTREIST